MPPTAGGCAVCEAVPAPKLVLLDTLMSDPALWPANVWGQFKPPKGLLPPRYRLWGSSGVGMNWLKENGYTDISRRQLEAHYRRHVPEVPYNREALVSTGVIDDFDPDQKPAIATAYDPTRFLRFYNDGIELGMEALAELRKKIRTFTDNGEPVPDGLLKLALDQGMKLAMSQANFRARSMRLEEEEDEDGFRAGSAPLPSARFGDVRLREIEGELRPVVDRGQADRDAYNARARQEGSPLLGRG